MSHKYIMNAIDRTFRDITKVDKPFGGKIFLLCGDFRQILPVIPRGSRAEIVQSCICKSYLWEYVQQYKLVTNEFVLRNGNTKEDRDFCQWILDVGSGNYETIEEIHSYGIVIPSQFISPSKTLTQFIDEIFPDINYHLSSETSVAST